MDKTRNTQNDEIKNREGFALLVTLSVLAVIIALTTVLLSYFEEVKQDAGETKALIQADLYYADIVSMFQSFKDKKSVFSVLYQKEIPLRARKGEFSLILHCKPVHKGVNVNWLGLGNNTEKVALYTVAQEIFDLLVQEYNIEDPYRLKEMLIGEIGVKNKFVQKDTSRLHQKHGIVSYKQFLEIINRYQFEVDDPEIGLVPWKEYFSFFPRANKIDVEYSSAELIAYLFGMDVSIVKEWTSLTENKDVLKDFVNNNNGDYAKRESILAGKTFLDASECSVQYAFEEEQYRFKFEYIQGEAKHFEFYGKQ